MTLKYHIFYLITDRCDADPQALSKYVLALIKKDKPIEELKSSMISQMDVFLQSETNNFVEMLFKIVDSKEYLKTIGSAIIKPDAVPVADKEKDGKINYRYNIFCCIHFDALNLSLNYT